MKRTVIFAVGIIALQAAAAVTLSPAEQQDASLLPYRTAQLHIDNTGEEVIRFAALRWEYGGPELVYPVTVAPRRQASLTVALPAMAVQQFYDVRLLGSFTPRRRVVAAIRAPITWPAELVQREAFITADMSAPYKSHLPLWPAKLLRNIFLAAVVVCVAGAGTLLLRGPIVRLVGLVALVVIASGITVTGLARQPLIERQFDETGRLLILTARRTVQWQSDDARWVPVYDNPAEVIEETLVVYPDGLDLTLRPHEVRLLRRWK